MKGQFWKSLSSLMITLFCLGSLLTTVTWHMVDNNNLELRRPAHKKSAPRISDLCKGCKELIDKINERHNKTWKKQEDNYQKFRSELSNKCHGFDKAILTQANTPVGSTIVFELERKKNIRVTPKIFKTFLKEHPFQNKTWDTCAVVGNGGILADSGCGKMIDSAQFVFRCNLPPLENYEKHVGIKTDLVTANPSIFLEKFGALIEQRRPFMERLRSYGNSMLLLPTFSYSHHVPLGMRIFYTTEDFESSVRPVFSNPDYLQSLGSFWRSKDLHPHRLSTGMMMVSLALESCVNVHLYGFWPFDNHPHGLYALTNHYYDDVKAKTSYHAMPVEFDILLRLHSEGVLRLHLGDCRPGEK